MLKLRHDEVSSVCFVPRVFVCVLGLLGCPSGMCGGCRNTAVVRIAPANISKRVKYVCLM